MLSTAQFVSWLEANKKNIQYNDFQLDLDSEAFIQHFIDSSDFFIQESATGVFPVVMHEGDYVNNHIKRSSWEFHMDGYAYTPPPLLIILYCIEPGRGDSQTCLYDSKTAIDALGSSTLQILNELNYNFYSPCGKIFTKSLIDKHPVTNELYCNCANQGFITPKVSNDDFMQTVLPCDSVKACAELYDSINQNLIYKHTWEKNSLFIFDNYRYIHGRLNQKPDPGRLLSRIWLTLKDMQSSDCYV